MGVASKFGKILAVNTSNITLRGSPWKAHRIRSCSIVVGHKEELQSEKGCRDKGHSKTVDFLKTPGYLKTNMTPPKIAKL